MPAFSRPTGRGLALAGALLVGLAGARPACAGGDPAAPVQVWQGSHAGGGDGGARLVRNEAQWQVLWQTIGRAPPGPLGEGAVAAAFLAGRQPTAGHRIGVTATRRGEVLCLAWRVEAPEGAAAQVLTHPWQVQLYRPGPDGPEALGLAGQGRCRERASD